jgi:hypothetical protein
VHPAASAHPSRPAPSCRLSAKNATAAVFPGKSRGEPLIRVAPESPDSSAQSRSYLRDECARHSNSALASVTCSGSPTAHSLLFPPEYQSSCNQQIENAMASRRVPLAINTTAQGTCRRAPSAKR